MKASARNLRRITAELKAEMEKIDECERVFYDSVGIQRNESIKPSFFFQFLDIEHWIKMGWAEEDAADIAAENQ